MIVLHVMCDLRHDTSYYFYTLFFCSIDAVLESLRGAFSDDDAVAQQVIADLQTLVNALRGLQLVQRALDGRWRPLSSTAPVTDRFVRPDCTRITRLA